MLHRKQYRVAAGVTIMALALTLTACGKPEEYRNRGEHRDREGHRNRGEHRDHRECRNYRSYGFGECGTTGNGKCHTTDATGGIH